MTTGSHCRIYYEPDCTKYCEKVYFILCPHIVFPISLYQKCGKSNLFANEIDTILETEHSQWRLPLTPLLPHVATYYIDTDNGIFQRNKNLIHFNKYLMNVFSDHASEGQL